MLLNSPPSGGTMLDQSFFEENCQIVLDYLKQSGSLSIVKIDRNLNIQDYNQVFLYTIGANHDIRGMSLWNLILPEDLAVLEDAIENNKPQVHFTIQFNNQPGINMAGHLVGTGDKYLLFCERTKITEDTIIREISKLNNQMANITRELNKKNIALEKANTTINKLLKIDSLTQISNRHHFLNYFQKMHAYASRRGLPLSLVMTDLDNFKNINDYYGHQAGDQVLIAFANLLKDNSREEDLAARYGGEEFMILLVHADLNEGYAQAERMRNSIENMEIGEQKIKTTASFGVASLNNNETTDQLIGRADQALYQAKNAGRNRVCRAGKDE
ncbi:MAG: sensor domain-containing diguanylate cyclase [Bacillota bacterium]